MPTVTSATYGNGNDNKVSPGENHFTLGGTFSGNVQPGGINLNPSQGSVDPSKTKIDSQTTSQINGQFHFAKGSNAKDDNGTMNSSVDGSNMYPTNVTYT